MNGMALPSAPVEATERFSVKLTGVLAGLALLTFLVVLALGLLNLIGWLAIGPLFGLNIYDASSGSTIITTRHIDLIEELTNGRLVGLDLWYATLWSFVSWVVCSMANTVLDTNYVGRAPEVVMDQNGHVLGYLVRDHEDDRRHGRLFPRMTDIDYVNDDD